MILVLLGTQKHKFERLIKYINNIAIKEKLDEEIIIQSGENDYENIITPKLTNIKCRSYLDDYEKLITKSDFIICHGGVGVIMDCFYKNKKILVVPRLSQYKEHIDDHQLEISKKLSDQKYLLQAVNELEFEKAFLNIKNIKLKKYKSNNEKFNRQLNNLIDEIIGD